MSYINKEGKTTAWRKMVIRQQLSDVFSYGKITTTLTKAKETQKHVDKVVTLAKQNTLASKRAILAIIKQTKDCSLDQLIKKIYDYAKSQETRKGGYTRVLKLGKRRGDNTEEAILMLVKEK